MGRRKTKFLVQHGYYRTVKGNINGTILKLYIIPQNLLSFTLSLLLSLLLALSLSLLPPSPHYHYHTKSTTLHNTHMHMNILMHALTHA